MARLDGTQGYANEAENLLRLYESVSLADVHGGALDFVPRAPCRILDIGSGTGRDAAAFVRLGHHVVAVEPVDELRQGAQAAHPSPRIEWVDDGLPELAVVLGRGESFDVVLLTGVWFHLDEAQRRQAMPGVASLVKDGGVMLLSLRHGPVPPGRRMFDVTADETIGLAAAEGLQVVLNQQAPAAIQRREPVTWTRLAFRKT